MNLLSNVADIYADADAANRRLCNQTLFKAFYVDEDNDVRVGYRTPYDGLSDTDLQADALTWAAQAKNSGPGENLRPRVVPWSKVQTWPVWGE